jgi:hypothetical protein
MGVARPRLIDARPEVLGECLRDAPVSGAIEALPVIGRDEAQGRLAMAQRVVEHRGEDRRQVFGGRVDGLENLGGGRLPGRGLVAFRPASRQLTAEFGYDIRGIRHVIKQVTFPGEHARGLDLSQF